MLAHRGDRDTVANLPLSETWGGRAQNGRGRGKRRVSVVTCDDATVNALMKAMAKQLPNSSEGGARRYLYIRYGLF